MANKIVLPLEEDSLKPVWSLERDAPGQFACGVDRLACLLRPPAAEEIIILQSKPDRINMIVARSAGRVLSVNRQPLAHCLWGVGRLFLVELRHIRGRWWRRAAQQCLFHPFAPQ